MRFNLGTEEHDVSWEYKHDGPTNCITKCYIMVKIGPKITDWHIISSGSCTCHEKDRFEKEKGRKISLARALKNKDVGSFSKDERTLVWKAYLNRKEK